MGRAAGRILLLSATDFEVAPLLAQLQVRTEVSGWPRATLAELGGVPLTLAYAGIGKANTAAAVAALGRSQALLGVLQIGIAGAYPGSGLQIGALTVAASEFDLDLGVGRGPAWRGLESIGIAAFRGITAVTNEITLDAGLVRAVSAATAAQVAAFGTSDAVSADSATAAAMARRHGLEVESMEGVAAAQVALALGLPFVELRAISNVAGERDKQHWRIHEAVAALGVAGPKAVATMWRHIVAAA